MQPHLSGTPFRRARALSLAAAALCLAHFAPAIADARFDLPPAVSGVLSEANTLTLDKSVNGSRAAITLARNFGGSIVSFTYRGQQYVNDDDAKGVVDYGRQLQSAANFEDLGECFNPTEAGGRYDKGKPQSSARLIAWSKTADSIESSTDMAFWMEPNEQHQKGCGPSRSSKRATNTGRTMGYVLKKKVTFGKDAVQNVLQYDTVFQVPEAKSRGRFVPVSIHLPTAFEHIYLWTADAGVRDLGAKKNHRGREVIIAATADRRHAMAVYSPKQAGKDFYGLRKVPNSTVVRTVYQIGDTPRGDHAFSDLVFFGTVDEVAAGLKALAGAR
jgi:hypothetical protein